MARVPHSRGTAAPTAKPTSTALKLLSFCVNMLDLSESAVSVRKVVVVGNFAAVEPPPGSNLQVTPFVRVFASNCVP